MEMRPTLDRREVRCAVVFAIDHALDSLDEQFNWWAGVPQVLAMVAWFALLYAIYPDDVDTWSLEGWVLGAVFSLAGVAGIVGIGLPFCSIENRLERQRRQAIKRYLVDPLMAELNSMPCYEIAYDTEPVPLHVVKQRWGTLTSERPHLVGMLGDAQRVASADPNTHLDNV